MKKIFFLLLLLIRAVPADGGELLISEITPEGSPCDWIEICFSSCDEKRIDVSGLFVTVYYGGEEKLSVDPVTMYSRDNPSTPYDERYVVVRFAEGEDETDYTGDVNGNGMIDVYVSGTAPWNTDSVVGIDDNSELSDGCIDFCAYSNYDSSTNSTVLSFVSESSAAGCWNTDCGIKSSFVNIGVTGLVSSQSIIRINSDTDSKNDFCVTCLPTPGRSNVFKQSSSPEIGVSVKNKYLIEEFSGKNFLSVNIRNVCDLRVRIFASTGVLKHESVLYKNIQPGEFRVVLAHSVIRKLRSGLYIVSMTFTSSGAEVKNTKSILVVNRYR